MQIPPPLPAAVRRHSRTVNFQFVAFILVFNRLLAWVVKAPAILSKFAEAERQSPPLPLWETVLKA